MEPDKFERYIKSKLEEREIMPSNDTWTRISSQLGTEDKKPNRGYFWYGVAASIILLVGISIFYFNVDIEEGVLEDSIVETPIEEESEDSEINLEQAPETTPDAIVFEESENNGNKTTTKEPIIQKGTGYTVFSEQNSDQDVAVNTKKEEILDTFKVATVPEHLLNSKIAEIVAQVDILELSTEVTDTEVDSLLLMAQEDILRQRLFNSDNTVDAMALLTEVEDELDQSFRDQIFKSLKAGFLKVRTAVADRND